MVRLLILLAVAGFAACGTTFDQADRDSVATKIGRGVNAVGQTLESASADLHSKVEETRIQAVIDNIRGLEDVEVQMIGEGHIRLIGVVADELTRREAERMASRIVGVGRVENALVVGK